MSRVKMIVAAAVFFAFTAVKLAFPAVAGEMKRVIVPQIQADMDFRAAMVSFGERITGDEGIVSALGKLYESAMPYGSEKEDDSAEEEAHLSALLGSGDFENEPVSTPRPTVEPDELPSGESAPELEPALEIAPEPTPEAVSEPLPEPTEIPESVAAFLESQRGYEELEKPDNVSFDMPELPFEYVCPASGFNSSGFGFRAHPIEDVVKFHYGTDIAAYYGTDILAFAEGTVLTAGDSDSYGLYVIIGHKDGYSTLYAHCSALMVDAGETVSKGQIIAQVGDTGVVTGAHLHFELLRDDNYLNPEYYF